MTKKVRIGLRSFLDWHLRALEDFASGAPLTRLIESADSPETIRGTRTMRRIGVDRSRAKVREYLTKQGFKDWKDRIYLRGRIYQAW